MALGEPRYLKVDDLQVGVYDVSPEAEYFWSQVAERRVVIRYCERCGRYSHPRQGTCANCFAGGLTWREVPGSGTVYTYSTAYRAKDPDMTMPRTFALVELADVETYLFTEIVPAEGVHIGLPVEPLFVQTEQGVLLKYQTRTN
ncbi:Zn-ribbon domain-containing OB-fold protein [Actinophytocola sp.]|uniref:Zn-ribbon domain-containing OB-fold protein n=1 Tax=Actinophytocola sp. TaxID=1872138 RepID=UPI003D6AFB58